LIHFYKRKMRLSLLIVPVCFVACQGREIALVLGGVYNDHADIMQDAEAYSGHIGENFELCDYSVFGLKPPVLTSNAAGQFVPGFGLYICGGSKDYATETFPVCYRKPTPSSAWETIALPSTMNNTENHNLVTLGEPEDTVLWLVGVSGRESFISNVSDSNNWEMFKPFEPKTKVVPLKSNFRNVNKRVYLVHSPNKDFTACYCNQDSTPCKTSEYTCTDINTAPYSTPGLIQSAASFSDPQTDATAALFRGYTNDYVLRISEWSENAIPSVEITTLETNFGRKEPSLVNVGGSLLALGGTNGTAITNAVSRYISNFSWEADLPTLSSGRKFHTVVAVPEEWLCGDAPPATSTEKSASALLVPHFVFSFVIVLASTLLNK